MNHERIKDVRFVWAVALTCLLCLLVPAGCGEDEQEETNPGAPGETYLSLAREIADTWIRTVDPEQNDWSWGDGVLMFGLSQLARRTGSTTYWDYLRAWMDHHIDQGYYIAFSDNCPTGITAVRLFEETGEAPYEAVMDRIWHYLQHVAARTSDGGLNHMGFMSGNQLWVDSLFMFGVYLNEMSRLHQDASYQEALAEQIRVFSSHLRDSNNGLFLHMWDDDKKQRMPEQDIFWARGNAWVFVMLAELLTTLPEQNGLRQEFLAHFTKMADTLASLQPNSGLWHTVLYDTATYQETSASALFAYGFHKAMGCGILGAEHMGVVRRAMAGVRGRLRRGCKGGLIVSGTSHGTNPGDRDHYAGITVGNQVPYGVGAVLLAAVEVSDWPAMRDFDPETPCPDVSDDPQTPDEVLARAVYRMGIADLEGAEEDFLTLAGLEPKKGEGHFGAALIQAFFAGFQVFDEVTRMTIGETSWRGFQKVIREETLPRVDRIKRQVILALQDKDFSLHIPVFQINRRGLYTPITDLRFDAKAAGGILLLLDLLEALFRIIS
jgi:unsaturated rhamnogalacturonyl hydrolase